mmetsp:Transcript_68678/g.151243  ORF Transcript_68678/g.151243 Transcript_68678/m.151243 type:complete len:161 (-) Transcript_68678:92-574(-)
MSSAEDVASFTGTVSACAMPLLSFLGLMDVEFSASLIHGLTRSVVLGGLGLLCLQGETGVFYRQTDVIQENCGFAMKRLGRGISYLLAGLYCAGARTAAVTQATAAGEVVSSAFGFTWYTCCAALVLGSLVSFWAWHGQRRSDLLQNPGGPDLDAYYISS